MYRAVDIARLDSYDAVGLAALGMCNVKRWQCGRLDLSTYLNM